MSRVSLVICVTFNTLTHWAPLRCLMEAVSTSPIGSDVRKGIQPLYLQLQLSFLWTKTFLRTCQRQEVSAVLGVECCVVWTGQSRGRGLQSPGLRLEDFNCLPSS